MIAEDAELYALCQTREHCGTCRKKKQGRKWRIKTFSVDPDFACPFGKEWENSITGLGDVSEKVAAVVGIKPCKGCKKRRDKLNKAVPLGDK